MAESFNLQKARTFEHCQEYEHCNAGGIIEAACEEIERLRADVDGLVEALAGDDGDVAVNVCINSREQAKRIQTLEAALIAANQRYQDLQEICDCQDENNRALSDVLIEERAGVIQAQDIIMAERGRWTPNPSDGQKKRAEEQLRAEGKL